VSDNLAWTQNLAQSSMSAPRQKPRPPADAMTDTKILMRARRLATRSRAETACAPCKAKKTKCSDTRPCSKCTDKVMCIGLKSTVKHSLQWNKKSAIHSSQGLPLLINPKDNVDVESKDHPLYAISPTHVVQMARDTTVASVHISGLISVQSWLSTPLLSLSSGSDPNISTTSFPTKSQDTQHLTKTNQPIAPWASSLWPTGTYSNQYIPSSSSLPISGGGPECPGHQVSNQDAWPLQPAATTDRDHHCILPSSRPPGGGGGSEWTWEAAAGPGEADPFHEDWAARHRGPHDRYGAESPPL
jgi:hypothetical protein